MAVEMEILGSEFGCEDPVVNTGDISEDGGVSTIPKGRSIVHKIFNNQQAVFSHLTSKWLVRKLVFSRYLQKLYVSRSIWQRRRLVLTMGTTSCG